MRTARLKPIGGACKAQQTRRAKMSATLKLTRNAPVMEIRRGTFDVLVDGKRVGSFELHDTFETPVAPGRQTLKVREGRYSSPELSFQVTDGQVISFNCHGRRITPIFLALSSVLPETVDAVG